MSRLVALAAVWAVALLAPIPVTVTYYHATPAQTDGQPLVASCGPLAAVKKPKEWRIVALSRDLFFRDGHKRCGDLVWVKVGGESFVGIVWDTMAARFVRSVDVLYPVGERAPWGKAQGTIEFIDGY